MFQAHFTRTSSKTANLLFSGPGRPSILITDIVSCPELLVDQRGLELSLLCQEYGINVDEVEITGIATLSDYNYNHGKDWVIYQAKHWRTHLKAELKKYDAQQQAYIDSKGRI